MKQYLLDTNIIVFLFRNKFEVDKKIVSVGQSNCFISEITLAELKMGAVKSTQPIHNHRLIEQLTQTIKVIPISNALDIFCRRKSTFRKARNTNA
jgi:tRNA(fMet)-specific endonuclease VapC